MKLDPKRLMGLSLAEMSLVAAVTLVAKADALAHLDALGVLERRHLIGQALAIVLCPVWMAMAWGLQSRLKRRPQRYSSDYVSWAQKGYALIGPLLMAMQAYLVFNLFAGGAALGSDTPLRAMAIFIGAVVAAQGNFLGKVSPPQGAAAPDPHIWSRTMLRIGWGMALVGAAIVVSAIVLPAPQWKLAYVAAAVALMVNSLVQRRALRPRAL